MIVYRDRLCLLICLILALIKNQTQIICFNTIYCCSISNFEKHTMYVILTIVILHKNMLYNRCFADNTPLEKYLKSPISRVLF